MIRIRLKLYLFISSACYALLPSVEGSNEKLFYDAVRAEASGDLVKAVEIYCEIAKTDHSANLNANLANLYFKLENYARVILHLRKAIWLDPENREYADNLAYALELASISNQNEFQFGSVFSAHLQLFWLTAFAILFWAGIFFVLLFFRPSLPKSRAFLLGTFWLGGISFFGWGWYHTILNSMELSREVIAVNATNKEDNLEKMLALRVFAGEGSEANTQVPLGSSLFLDLADNDLPRFHTSPTGDKWFLARSASGSNKGWVREEEFESILDFPIK
jgi:tetratricopeptide (TPR) repeat protein